jgi:colicin import membrane protein
VKKKVREQRYQLPNITRSRAFYYSLLLHAGLVLFFVIGVDWTGKPAPTPPGESQVMNAKAVDANALEKEVKKLKAAEQAKQREAERKVAEAEQKRKQEERKLEQLKQEKERLEQQKEAEQRKLEEQKEQAVAEKKKAEQEAKKLEEQKRAAAEKKKLEEKKQAEAKKNAEEQKKAAEEKKKKAEAEKKKAEEEKKKAEAEKKRKAEEAKRAAEEKRRAEEAKALADELAAEEAELAAAAQARQDQSELARYTAAIMRQVSSNFVAPNITSGLKCTLLVRMIPGGQVVDAKVVKSSGNATFDRQAELAVRKASPLPVPDEPRLFQQMKEIQFEFDPGAM